MDAAEAHQRLTRATGASRPLKERLAELPVPSQAPHLQQGVNAIASAMGVAHDELEKFVAAVRALTDITEEVTDDDGREIWLTAGEVELDQWTQRLLDATAVVRYQLGCAP